MNKTKPYKAWIAAAGAFITACAAAWPSGTDVSLKEGLIAVVLALVTGGVTFAKKNPPKA
jgi:hypothetical protein